MSLKDSLELLKMAHDNIEIKEGPFSEGKHSLTIDNDCLVLTINTGSIFKSFLLDEEDLLKNPQDLILEIIELLEEPPLNIKEFN